MGQNEKHGLEGILDIATIDSPRYKCFEAHGRTSVGYQTNGEQFDALQSVFVGDKDWGFRATYDFLTGNDYRAGNGQDVASSYNSNNVNFALGADLTPNSKIEFKGLRVHQQRSDSRHVMDKIMPNYVELDRRHSLLCHYGQRRRVESGNRQHQLLPVYGGH